MDIWQIKAADNLKNFLNDYLKADKIELYGSLLNNKSIDIFSDVDMRIFLHNQSDLNIMRLIDALSTSVLKVFGYEINESANCDTLRICFENGWRYDLTFIYSESKNPHAPKASNKEKISTTINQFWFISLMVLTKLGRNDFLIASHLALELCQLNIIIQMLIRDSIKNTNVHRFGDKENVPILHSLTRINDNHDLSENNNVLVILHILFCAAEQMDNMCTQLDPNYSRHSHTLKELCFQYNINAAQTTDKSR